MDLNFKVKSISPKNKKNKWNDIVIYDLLLPVNYILYDYIILLFIVNN